MKYDVDWFQGSSPLTRGKHGRRSGADAAARLIPAHAGKTVSRREQSTYAEAHPRSRGENLGGAAAVGFARWLIPAHAGKTARAVSAARTVGAHPRSRGENRLDPITAASVEGSSPLTRGKHPPRPRAARRRGLIPAHAGKTSTFGLPCCAFRAHPRSRGENPRSHIEQSGTVGSSPLTRGKPRLCASMICRPGLIPAHAGKTTRRCRRGGSIGAHPRSRGENRFQSPRGSSFRGSSPLTRGKPRRRRVRRPRRGLIPAHAGKTRRGRRHREADGAHPRSRGENSGSHPSRNIRMGSSPLTRGKRFTVGGDAQVTGLIPAHAGKT